MTGIHVIANQDPVKLQSEVEAFTKKKADVKTHYTCTPVIVAMDNRGQAQTQIVITCLILWECSEEDWRSHLFAIKTLLTKPVL